MSPGRSDSDPLSRIGPGLLLLLTARWTLLLATGHSKFVFMDWINLPFHEAGHLFLTPLGRTMHFLGGSIGQLVVPALLIAYFLRWRPSLVGAAFCTWWCGESTVNIAYYMADAREMVIPLVGGGVHDWNWLFYRFDMLDEPSVRLISGTTHALGVLVMAVGLAWIAFFVAPAAWQREIVDRLPARLREMYFG